MEHTYDFTTGKFQFTPLREGRRGLKIRLQSLKSFNSRPCVRGDSFGTRCVSCWGCFNSRPCVRGDVGQSK